MAVWTIEMVRKLLPWVPVSKRGVKGVQMYRLAGRSLQFPILSREDERLEIAWETVVHVLNTPSAAVRFL